LAQVIPNHSRRRHRTPRSQEETMSTSVEIQTLKEAHRKTWASGDYARIA